MKTLRRPALRQLFAGVARESIIRGLLATAGLFVAFVAALLSSVASEAGQFWPAVILASSSLLLAGVVGILTVPLLARRVLASRMNEVLRYDMTREGTVYFVLVLVIGIAALNTGNNLLFVVLSAMLAAVVVSGIASAYMLRGLRIEFVIPEQMFARMPAMARVRVTNTRAFAPALAISVVAPEQNAPKIEWKLERSTFHFPPKRSAGSEWFRWPDLSLKRVVRQQPASNILQSSLFLPYVGPKTSISEEVELRFDRRGRYTQPRLGLATRFPFAFLKKTRMLRVDSEIVVFPSVEPTAEFFEVLPLIAGEAESFVRGRGFDLYRIRDYSPEDDARHLDWKASAKSGGLKLREFTREDERKLRIVFDNASAGAISPERYEEGLELAASIAWHFASENADMSYAATEFESRDLFSFLRYLALVQPMSAPSVLDRLQESGAYNVIITAKSRGTIPTALWSSSYVIFLAR